MSQAKEKMKSKDKKLDELQSGGDLNISPRRKATLIAREDLDIMPYTDASINDNKTADK